VRGSEMNAHRESFVEKVEPAIIQEILGYRVVSAGVSGMAF